VPLIPADRRPRLHRLRSAAPPVTPTGARRRRAERLRRATIARLTELARSGRPIVAGPWHKGVGAELLYWIPLLNWLTTRGGADARKIVAVSRGGAGSWYADVSAVHVDLLDHCPLTKLSNWRPAKVLDEAAYHVACDAIGVSGAEWLHPVVIRRLFAPRWEWGASGSTVWSQTVHRLLPAPPGPDLDLPESYVAVRPSFNAWFPDTAENRDAFDRVVSDLAGGADVVLLRLPPELDDSEPFEPTADVQVVELDPRTNLDVQTRVVRGARVFLTSYGGISYLGPYVGTPTVALYADAGFDMKHFDAIERVGKRLAPGRSRLFRARHIGAIPAARASG
jgi:hypothetical protein